MKRIRVLTLNIWNRQGPWEQRLELIRDGIRRLDPDVVGLQEVIELDGRSQGHEIADGLGYEVAFGLAHDLGGGVHFGNAVLSRWPILASRVFPLPTGQSAANAGGAAPRQHEQRSLLLAELGSPHGKLPFFVTHLNWKLHDGVIREAQVQFVAERVMAEAPVAGLPPILVGDFNAQPEATEIRFLKGLHALGGKSVFLADCFDAVGAGPGFTYDPTKNPHAAVTHEFPRRIDYVFVRGPDKHVRGKPLNARVVLDELDGSACASDHYGVLVEVSI